MSADQLRAWARSTGLDPVVTEDSRMPEEPTTLRQWAEQVCDAEGITDPTERGRRWMTIRLWPKRYPEFPAPHIPNPPRTGRGAAPAVYDRTELDVWLSEHGPRKRATSPSQVERLAAMSQPMTLVQIARVLGVAPATIYLARDASLKRIAADRAGAVEVPDPVEGEHGGFKALYDPKAWAHFWTHRPGQGRRTRADHLPTPR